MGVFQNPSNRRPQRLAHAIDALRHPRIHLPVGADLSAKLLLVYRLFATEAAPILTKRYWRNPNYINGLNEIRLP